MSIFYMFNKPKLSIIGLLFIVLTLWLSACGKTAQGIGSDAELKQIMTIGTQDNQLAFDKSTLRAQSGERIELTFANNSTAFAHNWVLVDDGKSVADLVYQEALMAGEKNNFLPKDTSALLTQTALIPAGNQETISFTAPAIPGSYTFLCTYPGHYLAGMTGTLTVSAP